MQKFSRSTNKVFGQLRRVSQTASLIGGAAVAGFAVASIKSFTDTEAALRPMIERSRIGAESLQILAEAAKRAGSEDGLEGITDSAQELQLQLGELALVGTGQGARSA